MNLKKLLKSISAEMEKPSKDVNLNKLRTDMMMAAALLHPDSDTEVPASLFSLFENDARKAAMLAIITIYAQAAAQ
jgi:hypothetical protein